MFLQVCEVQYSNPSDIFRRVPVAKGDGAGADRLPGYGDLAAGIWPQCAGGLFGAAGKSKPPRDFRLRGFLVPRTGIEPARLAAHAPETCASTNSATWALYRCFPELRCAKVMLFFESASIF